jgi:hypothetical protein
LPGRPAYLARFNYEYTQHATRHLIMVETVSGLAASQCDPGPHQAGVYPHMAELMDVHVPEVEKIAVVLDNLSIPTPAALYEVFPPDEARPMLCKLE